MTTQTLRMCPPNLRAETMRAFERRLGRHVQETADLAQIAQQLDLAPIAADLWETHGAIEGVRVAVVGAAR